MNTRVLVTGGAGFIGSHLVDEFLLQGYSVRVIDNFTTGSKNNIKHVLGEVELIEGDIRDYHTVLKAVKNIDIIVHQAALPSVPRSVYDPITTNEVNVKGTLNLLWAAVEGSTEKFLFASSSSIYGDSVELPKHEKLCPNPLSPYAVSKLTAETYCKAFSNTYGLKTICLRYFNVFGPRQDPTSEYSAVIPKFIKLALENKPITIYGSGAQSRDFTYVDDMIRAFLIEGQDKKAIGQAINFGTGKDVSVNDIAKAIVRISQSKKKSFM